MKADAGNGVPKMRASSQKDIVTEGSVVSMARRRRSNESYFLDMTRTAVEVDLRKGLRQQVGFVLKRP